MKLWQWAVCAALVVASLVAMTPADEPKQEPEHRYHVTKTVDGLPMYLALDGKNQRFKASWVVDPSMAWRFGDKVSAQLGADQYGGVPLPIRSEE